VVRFVVISDTHGQHAAVELPPGDIIIHAGDVSRMGKEREIISFLDWFAALPYRYRVFVAGNHDFYFEKSSDNDIAQIIPDGVTYLNDTGVTIEGIEIWGSPITPWFFDWAFNRHRGADIQKHWALIPASTSVLVTHGPPYGILDRTIGNEPAGCSDLLKRIHDIKPACHIFGHIHEGYGQMEKEETVFINASVVDERYMLRNAPVSFDYSNNQL
jgi:Icc-related predicted phosphoesterase